MAGHSKWASIRHPKGARVGEAANQRRREPRDAADDALEPFRCEGYGPGGAAMLMDGRTDSRDRTMRQVRELLHRHGGHLGAQGSVSYLFNEVGLMIYRPGTSIERLVRGALTAGAEDVVPHADGSIEVLADPLEFDTVLALLQSSGFVPTTAEITQRASVCVLLGKSQAAAMIRLLEALDELNDIQNVYTNAEIPDEVLARI
ncbi:MAG TPA: YebC/PmpR family DNA-binding transcriptional regulator [Steroidobacteraceae bacterium]